MKRDPKTGRIVPKKPKPEPKKYSSETHGQSACLRWVMTHEKGEDYTHEQCWYRRIHDDQPIEFTRMWKAMLQEEKELADAERKKQEGGRDVPIEPGSERCMAVIEEILRGVGI